MTFFSNNALKRVSIVNKECKVRPKTLNINSNEPSLFAYSILVNNCSGSCKNINIHLSNHAFLTLLKT